MHPTGSREQNYRPENCGICHTSLIKKAGSGFWEGGKGEAENPFSFLESRTFPPCPTIDGIALVLLGMSDGLVVCFHASSTSMGCVINACGVASTNG